MWSMYVYTMVLEQSGGGGGGLLDLPMCVHMEARDPVSSLLLSILSFEIGPH